MVGDVEAMIMVARGIHFGFVDDDDESCFFWLMKAKALGSKEATDILNELDKLDEPILFTLDEENGDTATTASDLLNCGSIRAEPEKTMLDLLGVSDLLREERIKREMIKSDIIKNNADSCSHKLMIKER